MSHIDTMSEEAQKKTRKNLTIQDKLKIFEKIDKNPNLKQVEIAKEFEISTSTLHSILGKRRKIEAAALQGGSKRKRIKEPKFEDLEKVMVEWFHQVQASNTPVDGPIIKERAKIVAQQLNIGGFTASNGWLDRFRQRNNIKWRMINGESEKIEFDTVQDWKTCVLPDLLHQYPEKDVYSADEVGLFFNLMPDESMDYRTETCHGGKRSTERLTVLLACNMEGTDKLKPLVIGKSENPLSFRNICYFPCDYVSHKKSWMTAEVFEAWLKRIDEKMRAQMRNILLVIDSCSVHPKELKFLTNVRVEFLPPYTTSPPLPLYMGIIREVKYYYRKMVVRHLLSLLSKDVKPQPKDCKIDVYRAMHYLAYSWDLVTPETIQKCFKKSGFNKDHLEGDDSIETIEPNETKVHDEDEDGNFPVFDDGSFEEVTMRWVEIQRLFKSSASFDEFVCADDYTPVCQPQAADGSGTGDAPVICDGSASEEETVEDESNNPISRGEATDALDKVRRYFCEVGKNDKNLYRLVNQLENLIVSHHV